MMDQQALWERAERLRTSADDAASLARKIYVTFLLLGTYIGIIIGSTTDAQLLKISPVTLPLLNVRLPIREFYAFVPWLFVLFHFNLLLQCYLLARKLHPLDAAIDALGDKAAQAEQRSRLFAFPFSHMLIGHHHGRLVRGLLALIVWVTMALLPLSLLLWAQLRFLRYHSEAITWSQRAAVMVDLVMLWVFWPMIMTPSHDTRDWWKQIMPNLMQCRKGWGHRATHLWRRVLPNAMQVVKRRLLYILVEPVPPIQRATAQNPQDLKYLNREPARRARGMFVLTLVSLVAGVLSLFDAPGLSLPRGLQFAEKTLVDGDPSVEVLSTLKSADKAERERGLKKIKGLHL